MAKILLLISLLLLCLPLLLAKQNPRFAFIIAPCCAFYFLFLIFILYSDKLFFSSFYFLKTYFSFSNIYELLIAVTILTILVAVQLTLIKLNGINIKIQSLFNIFALTMILILLSNDLLTLYIGIEAISIVSALLVSISDNCDHEKDSTVTFCFNKIASIMFLCSLCIIYKSCNSIVIEEVVNHVPFSAASLIMLSALIKSAQFPFFSWLISAIRANIFASVLIHSSTIVGIGFIIFYKFNFLFENFPKLQNIIITVCLLSAVVSGILSIFEKNIKKIIVYSTISAMGLVLLTCCVSQCISASLYFMCHAFFKSAFFLAIAYVIHYNENNLLLDNLSVQHVPKIIDAIVLSFLLSIGLPFVSFFGKTPLFDSLIEYHKNISVIGVFINILSIICLMRIVSKIQNNQALKINIDKQPILYPIFLFMFFTIFLSFNIWNVYQFNIDVKQYTEIIIPYTLSDYILSILFEIAQIWIAYFIYFYILQKIASKDFNVAFLHNFIEKIVLKIFSIIFKINNSFYKILNENSYKIVTNCGISIVEKHKISVSSQLCWMILFAVAIVFVIVVVK